MHFSKLPKEMVISSGDIGLPTYIGCFLDSGEILIVSGRYGQKIICGKFNERLNAIEINALDDRQPYRITHLPNAQALMTAKWGLAARFNTQPKLSMQPIGPIFNADFNHRKGFQDALLLDEDSILIGYEPYYSADHNCQKLEILNLNRLDAFQTRKAKRIYDATDWEENKKFWASVRKFIADEESLSPDGSQAHITKMVYLGNKEILVAACSIHRSGSSDSAFILLDVDGNIKNAWKADQGMAVRRIEMVFDGTFIWIKDENNLTIRERNFNLLFSFPIKSNPVFKMFSLLSANKKGQLLWFCLRSKTLCLMNHEDTHHMESLPKRFMETYEMRRKEFTAKN